MQNYMSDNKQMPVSGGKILMITRKIDSDDALAGFAYNWVKKIGEDLDELHVMSWQPGDDSGLPGNIKVFFLPSDKIAKIFALQKLLFRILPKVDGVFCHMNPEYTILAGPLAKIFRKKIVSWYTHRAVTWRRRLMEIFADKILTASPESFREPKYPDKVRVIGHGIDTELFDTLNRGKSDDLFKIISIGRISPTKDYETIIKAIDDINDKKISLTIIGDVILTIQKQYLDSLKLMVETMNLTGQVEFVGWVANKDTVGYYQKADLFINMSGTGSLDKAVLEAMACECLVLTSNEAFKNILPAELIVEKNNPQMLAEKIKWLMALPEEEKAKLRRQLRDEVVKNHNLDNLVKKIISSFNEK